MKENIYTLLNEMDHGTEGYGSFSADPSDVKKWKKKMFGEKGKKRSALKYAAAAACVCLAGIAVSPAGYEVYAQVSAAVYNLSKILGIRKDLSPYSMVVGETLEKNGISVTLNDVILDDETILVSYMARSEETLDSIEAEMNLHPDIMAVVDGVMAQGASGSSEKSDENSIVGYTAIEVSGINAEKQMDIKLDFSVKDQKIGSIAFSATGAELMADTKTAKIDKSFTLPDGSEITIERFTTNNVNQKIYFTTASGRLEYNLALKGKDDCGNEVEFGVRFFGNGKGRMEVSTINNGFIDEKAKELHLMLYAVEFPKESGRMSNDFQPVGEEFTVLLPEG